VLSQAAAELTADSLPEDCVLVDLGSHRLQSLAIASGSGFAAPTGAVTSITF
jgi:hypothetical protein